MNPRLLRTWAALAWLPSLCALWTACRLRPRTGWISRIDADLHVGGWPAPWTLTRLARAGVGAVVDLCHSFASREAAVRARGMAYLNVRVTDWQTPGCDQLRRAVAFVAAQRAGGRAVLIHCKGGRTRSATVAAAVLMHGEGLCPACAVRRLRARRSIVNPAIARARGLVEFELQLACDVDAAPEAVATTDGAQRDRRRCCSTCGRLRPRAGTRHACR